ncbi:MAG: penicillin-binding protein 2 [Pseudomonadota bacterium]
MARTVRIKDHQNEQHFFLQRSLVAAFVIAALALVLLGRLVLLQIVHYDHYLDLAQGNRARKEALPATRGLILDRNGKVLAENQASYQLELTREVVTDLEVTLKGLVAINVLSAEELPDVRRMIKARRTFEAVPIRLRLTEEQRYSFDVHRHEFPGVEIQTRSARFYPYGALAVHALGYVGAINEEDLSRIDRGDYVGTNLIGKLGVEQARETELHGVNGYQEKLVNAQGRSVQKMGGLESTLRSQKDQAGSDLILSLDLAAQQAAEEGFTNRRGAAIAIDPRNGDVLVLASMPGFDPGMFGRGISTGEYNALKDDSARPLTNRALAGTYPSGSTIKPVLAMAGLAYGEITAEQTHYCPGTFFLKGVSKPWREGKGGVHGTVDMRTAIAESCDVYFYALADQLGVDRMHDFLEPFGYGRKTGIDISGEAAGILPSKEYKKKRFRNPSDGAWYAGDTVNFGIGQGFMLVTPLQIAQVAAVLAAKGAVFQPRLVTGIRDPGTGKTKIVEPIPLPHVKGGTPEQWDVIMEGMRATVTRGTGRSIASKEYTIAGKTGTAQAYSVTKSQRLDRKVDESLRDHSWFMAFAPAENPQIAVAVLVENGGFGASAAAPIVRKIMDAYLLPRLKEAEAANAAKEPAQATEPAAAPEEKSASTEAMTEPEPAEAPE